MAEQEVIKHTKKLYRIGNGKDSIGHKAKEFILEIVIIVFAVSLSIWLHERSEHKHQKAIVKQFLTGLKADIEKDIIDLADIKKSYLLQKNAFMCFQQAIKTEFLYLLTILPCIMNGYFFQQHLLT